ncbi:MAG TPA: cation transporter [Gammaproteobacteria bacterium]|nr:cation transporter [Gammaproteobacteria bacterium]
MSHGHHHDFHAGERRLTLAVAVNLLLTVTQVVGGLFAGSLALIADALHNLSDATALIIALVARRIAGRPADDQLTFGYRRAEVVAALINLTVLLVIAVYLVTQGVIRLFDPQPVTGSVVIIVATIALLVDLATVALTWSMSKSSVNIRAAMLHNFADALTSLGVIFAGLAIVWFDFHLADVLVTFLVAGYVFHHVFQDLRRVIGILMNSVPPHLQLDAISEKLTSLEGIASLHHQHLWSLDEHRASFDAHVVMSAGDLSQLPVEKLERVRLAIKNCLAGEFDIHHSTLEFEFSENPVCSDPGCSGGVENQQEHGGGRH